MLLVAMIFATAGATHKTEGKVQNPELYVSQASSCLSSRVTTSLCNELEKQSCNEAVKAIEPQIQARTVIIAEPQENKEEVVLASAKAVTVPEATPTQAQNAPSGANLNSDLIFGLINQYRVSLGLAAFVTEPSVCELAQVRSAELASEVSNGTIHAGLYNRGLPYWIWENAKVGSNEEETAAWWLASSLHRQSIVGDYKFSCIKCTGNNCAQLFTSFSPK